VTLWMGVPAQAVESRYNHQFETAHTADAAAQRP
jgi:hypothetical protein